MVTGERVRRRFDDDAKQRRPRGARSPDDSPRKELCGASPCCAVVLRRLRLKHQLPFVACGRHNGHQPLANCWCGAPGVALTAGKPRSLRFHPWIHEWIARKVACEALHRVSRPRTRSSDRRYLIPVSSRAAFICSLAIASSRRLGGDRSTVQIYSPLVL